MAENDPVQTYAKVKNLRNTLSKKTTTAEQVQLLNLQARLELVLGFTEKADENSHKALVLAQETDDSTGQAAALLNLSKIALNDGRINQSTEFTFRSYSLLKKSTEQPELLGEVMFWLTLAYRRIGRLEDSVIIALKAQEIAEDNRNLFALAYASRALALSYEQSSPGTENIEYSEKMIEYARKIPSKMIEAYGLQGMAAREDSQKKAGRSEHYMQQAITIYRELNSPFSVNIGLLSLARIYSEQGRHKERVELLNEVIHTYQKYPNPLGHWYALVARSEGHQQLSQLREAKQDADLALEISLKLGDINFHSQSLTLLAAIAAANNDHASAYQLTIKAMALANQAKEQEIRSSMADWAKQYEEQSHERLIEQLNRLNAIQSAQLRHKELQQRWLFTLLIGSLLLLFTTIFFLLRLHKAKTLLRGFAARLESIREEERKRIARDLHDEMGQYLTSLRLEVLGIEILCQGKESKIVERSHIMKTIIDNTIQVSRDIATSLRPAPLDMGGISSLEWLAEEFTKRTGVVCVLDVTNVSLSLNDKYMTAIFRIVQESLTNIARHAEASKVEIKMTTNGRKLFLQVNDNGKGFQSRKNKTASYGLMGMQERAIALGGKLDIDSLPNRGTCVKFHVLTPEKDEIID